MSKEQSDDEADFASLISGVKRLKNDRINLYRQRPDKAILRHNDFKQETDDFDAMNYEQSLEIRESYFDHGIQKKRQRRIRQGLLPVDDSLDLHGFTQKAARAALIAFLHKSLIQGHKFLIVIHGKGQRSQQVAVLKPMTLHWLSQQKQVLAWCPAQAKHGGSGASYVYLR